MYSAIYLPLPLYNQKVGIKVALYVKQLNNQKVHRHTHIVVVVILVITIIIPQAEPTNVTSSQLSNLSNLHACTNI